MKTQMRMLAGAALALLSSFAVSAQLQAYRPVTDAMLQNPDPNEWLQWRRTQDTQGYSTLDQINAGNVGSLTVAWIFRTRGVAIKSTPLMVNNILYFTEPDNVWAVDAKFGRKIWHYERKSEGGHIGHRGLAMYKKGMRGPHYLDPFTSGAG